MPLYKVNIPGQGSFDVNSRRELTDEEAIAAVMAQLQPPTPVEPEATPESGFVPAFKAGVSGVKEAGLAVLGRTGLMDEEAARQAIEEEQAYQRRTFAPTEEGFLEAPLTKTTELLGGSLPYMAAPLVAAGATALAPLTGTAATVAGLGAAGLASAGQFTGTNLLRQMETGKSIGETDLGNAALAAVPQAALDTLSLRMLPFIRNIFGQVGKDLTEEAALEVAKKTLKDGAADYALTTGRTMGVEGLTETAQQALERLQAGLTMGDEDARDEYFQSFIGGAVLGGVLAPPGRYLERRGIQTAVEKREAEITAEERRLAEEAAAEEEARKGLGEADAPLLTAEEATMQGDLLGPVSMLGQRQEEVEAQEAATAERAQELQTTYQQLVTQIEALKEPTAKAAQAGDSAQAVQLAKEGTRLKGMLKQIEEQAKADKVKLAKPVEGGLDPVAALNKKLDTAKKALVKAGDLGEFDKIEGLAQRVNNLETEIAQTQPSLFGEENLAQLAEQDRLAAEEEAKIQRGENVFNVSKRIIRQSRQQTEQEREAAEAQAKSLERIEFGLENMGLSALGIPATRRKAIEEQINRGIVLPPTAELLGISVDKRTTADKALPQIEDAMRSLNEQRQGRFYDILNNRVELLDEKGELTDAGRQAIADEAKMQELNRLRTVGLSKLDARAAEDAQVRFEQALELDRQEQQRQELAAEAPATERFGRILEQQTGELKEPPAAEVMPGALGRSKNEIFGNFSDAVRELQTGKFLSAREGVPEKFSPEEKARNDKLRDQIFLAAREENVIKDRLKQPGVVRNAALSQQLQQRLTQVQTDLKKFRSGLTRAPEAGRRLFNTLKKDALKTADAYINKSMAEIEAARLAGRRPALTDQERTDIELKLRTPFQVFVDRVSSTELKGRISSVPAALKTLEADLNEVVETAKGVLPETDLPIETAPPKAPKAPRKEPTSRIETIARTLEDVEARLEETKPAGVSNVSFFEKRIKDLKEQLKLVEDASSVGGLAEYYDPKFSRKQITTSIDRYEKALADEKAKVRERESLTRVKEKLESERETTTEKAAETREVPLVVARQNAINKAIDGIVANREEIGLIKRDDAGKEIRTGLTGVIYDNGVLAARLKKQVQGKRDPETRARIKQLETEANAARKRVQLLGEINKRLAASLRNLGFDGFINKDGEYILRSILNEQQEPTKWAEEAGESKAKVVDAYNDATKKINDVRGQIAAQEDVVAESVREAKKAQARIGQFDVASDKEQARKKYDEAKEKAAQERKKLNSLQTNLEQEIKNRSEIINRGTQPLKKARDKTEEKEGRRLTYDERASAVQALNKRIDATLKAAKPTQEQEALAAKMRAIQAGEIKTPTGKALPLTKGRRDFEQAMVAARPQDISTDVEALEKEYAALEAKFDAATSAERKKMGTRKTQITKKLKRLREAKEVSIPVFTADTLFPTNNEMQSLLDAQKRYLLDDLKSNVDRKDTLNTLIDVQAETMAKVVEAKLALSQAKSDLEKRNAKAALKKANDAYTRATALRYEEELELADLAIDNGKPSTAKNVIDVVSIEDIKGTQQEVEASLEAYRKSDETDFRVGDTDFEVAVDEAEAAPFVKELEAKAKAQNIKFKAYKDFSEVPMKILKALAKQGMSIYADKIKGGVAPDGEVFVIVSHHKDLKDLEQTAAHELVGHYTLEGVLGKDGVRRLLKRVETSFPGDAKTGETGVFALAKELGVLREAGDAWLESVESTKELVAEGKMTKAQQVELAKMKALREVLAYTTENYFEKVPASKAEPIKKFFQELVFAFRRWLAANNFVTLKDVSTPEIFSLIKSAYKTFDAGKAKTYRNTDGTISLRSGKAKYNPTVDQGVVGAIGKIVAPETSAYQTFKANVQGLNFRTQFIDRFDALERIKQIGQATLDKVGKPLLDHIKATDLTYFIRNYDQRMSYVSEAATNGVVQLIKDPKTGEYRLSRDIQKDAPSLKKVAEALAKAKIGDTQANGDFFTAYMAAERAESVGAQRLGIKASASELAALRKAGRADPAIQEARKLYNAYNNDLISLLEQSGAISKEKASALKSRKDYIPYYREDASGTVNLFIDGEKIMRMGDTTEQPYLKELVGSDQKIRDFFVTSLQNTNMIMDLALRNLGTRNVGFVLQGLGIAKRVASGKTGPKIIRAKIDGVDTAWEIDTKGTVFGDIPAEIIVKGMDGIKSTMPGFMKLFSFPADVFRKFITRDPAYAIRQIFRDSTAAYMATGSNATPVLGALKELKNMYGDGDKTARQLMAGGLSGGQVITGSPEDMKKIIQQVASGKPGWSMAMAKLDGFAMAGDMATRVAAYKSFIKQGLTEREAELASLEIMNFSRRGVSPSVLFLNSIIPFLSANIQGLDVLYRGFTGKMGYSERLKIQEKLFVRGAFIALATAAYAVAMDDDETYENARPSERYGNWFVPVAGLDGALRVPIPFELGLIFKVLPEAVVRAAKSDEKGSEIIGDIKDMLMKSVPGDIPLAAKPALEVLANYSFFTNSAVVGARLSGLDKAEQYTDKTPELLRSLGALGISPAQAEYLVRGYTGSLGIGVLALTDAVFSPAKTAERIAMGEAKDIPFLGRLVQPNDSAGMIDKAYQGVEDARTAQRTYNNMMTEGRVEDAEKYVTGVMDDIMIASAAGTFTQIMGEMAKLERIIKASTDMDPEEKKQQLDDLRQNRIDYANEFRKLRSEFTAYTPK